MAAIKCSLGIIGSRGFNNFSYAASKIVDIIRVNNLEPIKIVSGGAVGADAIAEKFAKRYEIPIEIFKPDWSIGKHAGHLRNTDIVKNSDFIIAFWDGKSKGTVDTINKAKRLNKKTIIVNVSADSINEGIRIGDHNELVFDFKEDQQSDILTLKYNKNYITTTVNQNIRSYYSYELNKKVARANKSRVLNYVKTSLIRSDEYELFVNKAVLGLMNNPHFNVADVDMIVYPASSSQLNYDIAQKIKNKIPNALFAKDFVLKNEPKNVQINYDLLNATKHKKKTIIEIEDMVKNATVDGVFKIKNILSDFRKYIFNFLKLSDADRRLYNKLLNGKVLVIDDIRTEGTTLNEVNRLLENYGVSEVILYSIIGKK